MQSTIEAIACAWGTKPKSVLHMHGDGVSGARWLCGPEHSSAAYMSPHFPDVHVVSLVLRGFTGECWLDGKHFYAGRVSANRLRVVPAGHTPSWRADSPVEMFHLYVPDYTLRRQLAVLGYRGDAISSVLRATSYISDSLLQQVMYRLAVTAGAGGRLQKHYLQKLEETLILHLLNHYAGNWWRCSDSTGENEDGLVRAIQAIDENLQHHLSIRALAAVAGLSPSQFNRRFRQATNFTPHQYRLHRRIEAAKLRLADGEQSLAAIAHDFGFADQPHFTRAFRQLTGMTPGEYHARRT